jgi:HAD superfamily hydrolase (TIGR01509 family)
MIDAVIFDIDGTLIDSVDLHAQAWLDAMQVWGKFPTFAAVRHQIGKGGDQLLRAFFDEHELARVEQPLSDWREAHFRERLRDRVKPFPGVRALFEEIRRAGKRIALASSAKGEELEYYTELLEIDGLIEDATSKDDVKRSKPHPDVFKSALAKLGDPEVSRVLAVGDTPWDAISAGKAGLSTIGVLCGGFPREELVGAGCIAIYRDPEHLRERLGSSPIMDGPDTKAA